MAQSRLSTFARLAAQVIVGIAVFCNEAPIDIFSSIGPVASDGTGNVNVTEVRSTFMTLPQQVFHVRQRVRSTYARNREASVAKPVLHCCVQAPDGGWNTIAGFYNGGAITTIEDAGEPGSGALSSSLRLTNEHRICCAVDLLSLA